MLYQISNQSLLTQPPDFADKPSVYVGFDPTAESIHLGNLASLIALHHFRAAGFRPLILLGGATGLIGDPSGRKSERNLLDHDQVGSNLDQLLQQFKQLNSNITAAITKESSVDDMEDFRFINNIDFYEGLNSIDFLRDVGKHFRVNSMLAKDSVKSRMATSDSGEGISFTEFSYQVLQAYDFYNLYQQENCKVQVGGSDQWGNITAGCDFIRRKT